MTHWIYSERTLYGDVSERIFSSSRKEKIDSFKIKKLILRGPENKSEVTQIKLKVFPLNRYDPVNKWVAAFKQETNLTMYEYSSSAGTWHNESFVALLLELKFRDPDLEEILLEICKILKLEINTLDELYDLRLKQAIDEVVEYQEKGDYSHKKNYKRIWSLGQLYIADSLIVPVEQQKYRVSSQRLYELLNQISEKSPYYSQANNEIVHLLMRVHETSNDEKENTHNLELIFRHAIRGSNQELTDKLYHELCGMTLDDELIEGIQGNVEILIKIAERQRALKQRLMCINKQTEVTPESSHVANFFKP